VPVVDVATALREARAAGGLLSRQELRALGASDGALTRALARGDVVRVHRGVYGAQALPVLPRFLLTDRGLVPEWVAHVRAALLAAGPRAAARGRTAALLHGWGLLHEPRRVELVVPHGTRTGPARTSTAQARSVTAEEVVAVTGLLPLRATPPVRTVLDLAVALPHLEAVVAADSALRTGSVSLAELRDAVVRLPGRRTSVRARAVVEACDPECGSVLESVQRVQMVQAGLTGFATQVVLRGVPELRVDFCFAHARLVVEVDGARWHPDGHLDRARDNALAARGWRVLRFTWAEVVHEAPRVLADVRAALEAGSDVAAA
jgi:very-short-patch-repair endonuclease